MNLQDFTYFSMLIKNLTNYYTKFHIGQYIVGYEQKGEIRAEYYWEAIGHHQESHHIRVSLFKTRCSLLRV